MADLEYPRNREEAYLYGFTGSGISVPEPVTRREAYLERILNFTNIIRDNFVTPEMYGAVGDGVTDDSVAFTKCFSSGVLIGDPAKNYRVKGSFLIRNNLIKNCNFKIDSQDSILEFMIIDTGISVSIENCKFESTLDKTAVAPAGHTRVNYNSSNIVAVSMQQECGTIRIKDCEFTNMEWDIKTTLKTGFSYSAKTIYDIHNKSTGSACHIYASHTNEVYLYSINASMRDDLGRGDHFVYIQQGVNTVYIDNVNVTTDSDSGSVLHFYESSSISTNAFVNYFNCDCNKVIDWYSTGTLFITNSYLKATNFMAQSYGSIKIYNSYMEWSDIIIGRDLYCVGCTVKCQITTGNNSASYIFRDCDVTFTERFYTGNTGTVIKFFNCALNISASTNGAFDVNGDNTTIWCVGCTLRPVTYTNYLLYGRSKIVTVKLLHSVLGYSNYNRSGESNVTFTTIDTDLGVNLS